MSDREEKKPAKGKAFSEQIGVKAARKLKAQRQVNQTVWSGLGMMGLIGWSVTLPTLLGAALGFWLDKHYPGSHSWTLALLALGLGLGCFNAWHWVAKEGREIRDQESDKDE
ncbi:AtpZ/AtpI family protein [Pseudomonas sp. RTC3]|uniref:AtpZ/AtpI family protein n=1 Tax=unclassified Pseudomonas TaxID=196821 RepID=UPI002AB54725|nr:MULTISPECIES: AtpZ/AtpI family protein [unclassified Pseudomonas]MEB0062983.1 AtpZ/AtpI family protein [Pseudomonas sp. RTC3]MDY7564243.1 AtpZ/AtpI family protein [Pseudomonas sp. 5C2]MEB0009456.1 AtpZ/AtpI family protein [Pseudomonas sp. RTB2]MEB0017448.1 AtpZ/AtpI family protein [Pseudomonas sp. RTB3]MEB0028590.1 AtpZ/AtpI family protein [Pseudomonas sp. MH9.2]